MLVSSQVNNLALTYWAIKGNYLCIGVLNMTMQSDGKKHTNKFW